MTEDRKFELNALAEMMHVLICYYEAEREGITFVFPEYRSKEGMKLSVSGKGDDRAQAQNGNLPAVIRELDDIYYGVISLENGDYLTVGPICTGKFDFTKKWNYQHLHGINRNEETVVPHMDFVSFLRLLILAAHMLTGRMFSFEQVLEQNADYECSLQKRRETDLEFTGWDSGAVAAGHQDSREVNAKTAGHPDSQEAYHHTYEIERSWADALREGDMEKAKMFFANILGTAGTLSGNSVTHSRYLFVAMVTIATRVAVENGVQPEFAYGMSDRLINQIDRCTSESEIWAINMEAMTVFSESIREAGKRKRYSGYVEQCKQYIDQNYRQKVTLEKLAQYTGLNDAYLSHLFSQMEGFTIKDYLNQVRIERAQNLLKYSGRSIMEISDYVGFQSQSYFGKMFKRVTGMTPAKYRSQFQIREFGKEKQ